MGAGHVDDELGAGTRVELVGSRYARGQVAQAIGTVDKGRWRFAGLDPRRGHAFGNRHGFTGDSREVQRVGGGLLYRDIAEGGGDADHVDGRMRQRKVQGHCVIHAGVGIENNFGGGGHNFCSVKK